MKAPDKLTKRERVDWSILVDAVNQAEFDLLTPLFAKGNIPTEWLAIAEDLAVPKTTRITARFDADVVKFFRSLGAGYQAKMNRILRSYMMMRITGVIEGPEGSDIVKKMQNVQGGIMRRPYLGQSRDGGSRINRHAESDDG